MTHVISNPRKNMKYIMIDYGKQESAYEFQVDMLSNGVVYPLVERGLYDNEAWNAWTHFSHTVIEIDDVIKEIKEHLDDNDDSI